MPDARTPQRLSCQGIVFICTGSERNSKEMILETKGLYHINNTDRKAPSAAGSKHILNKEGVLAPAQAPAMQPGHFRLQIETIKPY